MLAGKIIEHHTQCGYIRDQRIEGQRGAGNNVREAAETDKIGLAAAALTYFNAIHGAICKYGTDKASKLICLSRIARDNLF